MCRTKSTEHALSIPTPTSGSLSTVTQSADCRYLNERFKHLKLGTFDLGRRPGKALEIKSVVSYNKNWVKNQQRMTATSNLETYRATVEGRVVVDMLRSITIAHNLSTFTLAECAQVRGKG